MIARIEGTLVAILSHVAQVRIAGGITLAVEMPAYTAARLGMSIGQAVSLCTFMYFEGQNQGATLIPHLVGFLSEEDKRFYELFTTCKGVGNRRALRAMTLSTDRIAAAIADRDLSTLQSLPEIGKRMAETVVATLHGKVDRFVSAAAGGFTAAPGAAASPSGGLAREALEALLQLGENRTQALTWIDQVLAAQDEDERPRTAADLIAAVYRIKSGG
jgi:Holliday junction DNA helicase RuvA